MSATNGLTCQSVTALFAAQHEYVLVGCGGVTWGGRGKVNLVEFAEYTMGKLSSSAFSNCGVRKLHAVGR